MLTSALTMSLDLPFNQWPMIEAHDSATGYLPVGFGQFVHAWAVTQPSDQQAITAQLNCGARAFDWRPKMNDHGHLVMHHGNVEVPHNMTQAVEELVAWAGDHPSGEDIILLAVTDCEGEHCYHKTQQVLADAGVPTQITDCSRMQGMTLRDALNMSALPNGGHILPVYNCVDANYHPEVACSGWDETDDLPDELKQLQNLNLADLKEEDVQLKTLKVSLDFLNKHAYSCHTKSKRKSFPIQRMFDYLDSTSQKGPPTTGRAWSLQALWQESVPSIVLGVLHFSSLLHDESRSQLNRLVTDAVKQGRFPHINLLEINNVCDGGMELLTAIRSHAAARQILV